ncbi:MAG: response regulator [Myxococcota bacterium]
MIWLVDDDPAEHELLALAFAKTGDSVDISGFYSAEDALEGLSRGERPNLILLDLNMPGRGGLYFLDQRRARGFSGTPVLVYSSSSSPDDVTRAYSNGASAYLQKPSDFSDATLLARRLRTFWLGSVARLPESP